MQTAKELEQFTTCNISSFELMTKWLDVGYTLGLSSNALQLMTVLLRFYNPLKKYVFPHQDTLATRTNTSVASVKRGLNELLKANLIVKTRTRNGNLYAFTGKLFELLESSICTKETAQNEPCMNHEPIKRTNKTSTNKQKNVVAFTKNFQNKREIISLEDVPEIIQKKAKTNPCGYWASIPKTERERIWQEQKKIDEKRAKTQAKLELKKKIEAQEQLKTEKEYILNKEDTKAFVEKYSEALDKEMLGLGLTAMLDKTAGNAELPKTIAPSLLKNNIEKILILCYYNYNCNHLVFNS